MQFFVLLILLCKPWGSPATEDIEVCLPTKIAAWEEDSFRDHVQSCLLTNFQWRATNASYLQPYIHTYMTALNLSHQADLDDDHLYYKRRILMTTLRDTQLKVTHHIHAIRKCAYISHKMPTKFMDAYTNEAQTLFEAGELWTHHIKQDLYECNRVLFDVVKNQHYHLYHHIVDALKHYVQARDVVERTRESFSNEIDSLKNVRSDLIQYIAEGNIQEVLFDIPPKQNNQTDISNQTDIFDNNQAQNIETNIENNTTKNETV